MYRNKKLGYFSCLSEDEDEVEDSNCNIETINNPSSSSIQLKHDEIA